MRGRSISLIVLAGLLVTVAGRDAGAQSGTAPGPGRAPRAFVVPRDADRAPARLEPDTRPWTEKVTGELRRQAAVGGGDARCIVVLREPAALRVSSSTAAGDPGRLRFIDETVAALVGEYAGLGMRVRAAYSHVPALAVDLPLSMLEVLAGDGRVDMVQPDRQVGALREQGRALIHQPVAQALGYDGAGIGIAIVDTGVDYTHVELSPGVDPPAAGKVVKLYDAIDDDRDPMDKEGHGTSVAGIAGGALGGVAPGATIVAVRVLDSRGIGFDSEVLAGLNAVLASVGGGNPYKIKVVNLSLGGYDPDWSPSAGACDAVAPAYKTVFDALTAGGVLVVAAAGNGACAAGVGLPACLSSAMAIGATYDGDIRYRTYAGLHCDAVGCQDLTTVADQITCYSDSGEKLEAWAPSSNVKTPALLNSADGCSCENGSYDCCFGGTSAAAPYVAGSAAVLFQAAPSASPAAVRAALRDNGRPITDARNGLTRNRIDLQDALAQVLGGCTAPAAPTGITSSAAQVCLREAFTVSWTAVSGAAAYTVQVAAEPTFAAAREYLATTPTITLAFAEEQSASFHVRVRASSSCGSHSDWSPAVRVDYTPECGDIAYTVTYFAPGAVHAAGAGGSVWMSDLSLLNGSDAAADVRVSFHGATTVSVTTPLPAHQQATWADVLGSVFGVADSDAGALVVESTRPLAVSLRTYSKSGEGAAARSYGQSFQGLTASSALGWGHVGYLAGLRSDPPFATALDLVNPGTVTALVEVRLFGAEGTLIGSALTREVEPERALKLDAILPSGVADAYAEVRVLNTGAAVLAAATVVDGNSGDPTTIPLVVP